MIPRGQIDEVIKGSARDVQAEDARYREVIEREQPPKSGADSSYRPT